MKSVQEYVDSLIEYSHLSLKKCRLFAKVLSPNDDSGRHGVLIPINAYDFFPALEIPDPTKNVTRLFSSYDGLSKKPTELALKYYERYPERRVTRVNGIINDANMGRRLQVFLRGELSNGDIAYVHDAANEIGDGRFALLWNLIAGESIPPIPGAYVIVPVKHQELKIDKPLEALLEKFDSIKCKWFDSLRTGDTGIGYTFETLLGIKENNDQVADFYGIELKCKQKKEAGYAVGGKINLFQNAPVWINSEESSIDRLKLFGQLDREGRFSCYSQVTTIANNLLLRLILDAHENQIDLHKAEILVGHWPHKTLQKRLLEKHSRAAFIATEVKNKKSGAKYSYNELVYCEQPTIERFLNLVSQNKIVFEFAMRENSRGGVRNHGYPWRLISESLLDQLFTVRARLR
jgi:MvaI/BcnI restriction endonuclease family